MRVAPTSQTRGICVVIALASSVACAYSRVNVQTGKPLDEQNIKRIVVGKATRSDVFDILGAPHSMFSGQVELQEARLLPLYLHKENRYLSSIDDAHYALLYRFAKASSTSTTVAPIVVVIGVSEVSLKSDELLLLLNRNTNVVEDVAYRRETR